MCHDYQAPFLSVAQQYAALFKDTPYRVITVFIKGVPDAQVAADCGAAEVIFLDQDARAISGLKRKQIAQIKMLHKKYDFSFAIAHRYKALYIASHIKGLFCVGVSHIDGFAGRLFRRIYLNIKRKNIALLGVSKAIRDDMRQRLPAWPPAQIQHLYNGLDYVKIRENQLDKKEARAKLKLPENDFLFVSVGRLHPDKDQATLISAFHQQQQHIPNAKLLIFGRGKLEQKLRAQIAALGLADSVLLMGNVPELYRYLTAFDVFVLSSIREGMPVALLEAFAAQLPCIASRCNGNSEAIENVGSSFAVGDSQALSLLLLQKYQESDDDRALMRIKLNQKITTYFAEDAVRQVFWALPFMQPFCPPFERDQP